MAGETWKIKFAIDNGRVGAGSKGVGSTSSPDVTADGSVGARNTNTQTDNLEQDGSVGSKPANSTSPTIYAGGSAT